MVCCSFGLEVGSISKRSAQKCPYFELINATADSCGSNPGLAAPQNENGADQDETCRSGGEDVGEGAEEIARNLLF